MRLLKIIFLVAVGALSQAGFAQVLHYDALRKDKVVGGMDIQVIKEGNRSVYKVKSHMDFRFLVSLKVRFINEETFVNGVLMTGMVNNKMIGFKESEAEIKKREGGYDLQINGVREPIKDQVLEYTVTKIYTEEPTDGQLVFSQYYGEHFKFVKIRDHQYKFSSPEGDNYYTYTDGICTDIKIERDFATIYFTLKPESLANVKSSEDSSKN